MATINRITRRGVFRDVESGRAVVARRGVQVQRAAAAAPTGFVSQIKYQNLGTSLFNGTIK